MTEVLAPPVGEVLTAETVKLLVKGDLLMPVDLGTVFEANTPVVFLRASVMKDSVRVQAPHCGPHNWFSAERFTFLSRPSLAAPTVQEGEDLGLLRPEEAFVPDMNKSGEASATEVPVTEKLRPCPFCGENKANAYFTGRRSVGAHGYSGRWHGIKCHSCGAEGAQSNNAAKTAQMWNRRTSYKSYPVEALESALRVIGTFRGYGYGDLNVGKALDLVVMALDESGVATSTSGMKAEGRNKPNSENPNPHEAERRIALEADGRDPSGETVMGMRVAGYRWKTPVLSTWNWSFAAHWSTPGQHQADVERLFTEDDVRALLTTKTGE